MDHIGPAWEAIKDHLVEHALFAAVFTLICAFSLSIGALVWAPIYVRGLAKAMAEQRGPDINDLFDFDRTADDVVAMLLAAIVIVIAFCLCVLPVFAAIVVLFWVPIVAAEGRYTPADCLKVSIEAVKADPVQVVLFLAIGAVVNAIAASLLYLPLLITLPLFSVAQLLWYNAEAEDIHRLAAEAGIRPN